MMFQKEYIKNRMLKEVARIWNVDGRINEDSFDPIVNMLVTALSSEAELIYKEIARSEDRVAGSLMSKLTPYINKGVQPGHAMVLLNPGELNEKLPSYTELVARVQSISEKANEFYFVTTLDVNLFQGGVTGLRTMSGSYNVVDNLFKVESDYLDSQIKSNHLVVEIEYIGDGLDLDTIPLFFDLKSTDFNRRLFFDNLSRASFYINDIPVSRKKISHSDPLDVENERPLISLENSVIDFYSHQYYLIETPSQLKVKKDIRNRKMKNSFSIRIEFGNLLYPELIKELSCYVNVVPVINVRKRNKIYKSKNNLSVIHLSQSEPFYCIDSICSDEGKKYYHYEGGDLYNEGKGFYYVRKKDVEGLDERTAMDMVDYLLCVLRNENAVFSNIANGNIANDLKVLKQIVSKIEHSLPGKPTQNDSTYIFLDDDESPEYLFVDYYTTNGNETGGLKINHPLFAVKGTFLSRNGNYTLTPLVGGRDVLNDEEYIYEVSHSLLSGGRIVSAKDISALLRKCFGKYLVEVQIDKGMMVGSGVNQGYLRTIDINVNTDGQLSRKDCCAMGKIVLCELENRGSEIYPYRLVVDGIEVVK